jgi:formyltetrahydrofolate synthetase
MMDPLSIVATSLTLAGLIAKASMTLFGLSQNFRDAAPDIDAVSKELQYLAAVLEPLTRALSNNKNGTIPDALVQQIQSILGGCAQVIERIEENVQKYKRDSVWAKSKWAVYGHEDMKKLRDSLEAYKLALGLGLQVISMLDSNSNMYKNWTINKSLGI